ncbi:MAG: ATP-binding cassette domain-containing protein, partial [Planctomycetota bacterium]
YLGFVAEIRGVPVKQRSSAVDRVVQTCGLSSVFKKTILELSKGFRQRVGLAQAMIHDPEILILDEPTSGLDPNQIIEIRDLIRAVGEDRTVILSTHYLQEVEATCNNIMIVAEGNLVAEGSAEDLESKMPLGPLVAQILGPARAIEAQLAEVFPGSSFLCQPLNGEGGREGTSIRIEVKQAMDVDAREAVYDLVAVNRWKLVELHREPATLEHVFRKYTAGAAAAGARPVGKD